ncbi:MAG: hypothetical protein HW415_929 [Deltaproteobacteria bacterium]|nr:hypothetical protein [Deltaproteobacteria bacterium]
MLIIVAQYLLHFYRIQIENNFKKIKYGEVGVINTKNFSFNKKGTSMVTKVMSKVP